MLGSRVNRGVRLRGFPHVFRYLRRFRIARLNPPRPAQNRLRSSNKPPCKPPVNECNGDVSTIRLAYFSQPAECSDGLRGAARSLTTSPTGQEEGTELDRGLSTHESELRYLAIYLFGKGFCSVLHAKKVRYTSRYPSITLSKITIDIPPCCPSITFHTCLISFAGDQASENGMGTGGLTFRKVSQPRPQANLHLKAEGPM